ncbi:MAG: DUF6515 family protein [Luteolibacter sp.]
MALACRMQGWDSNGISVQTLKTIQIMKTSFTNPALLGGLGLALATMLPSCVDPNYSRNQVPPPRDPGYSAGYSVGYEVGSLPTGYRTEVIGGTQYYNYNGTYYRPHSGRYVVVEAPRGYDRRPRHQDDVVVVRELPRGYRVVNHRGVRYYQVQDTYYEKRDSGYVQVHLSL